MRYRRWWILLILFLLQTVNYVDRIALSVAAKSIAGEFSLSPVEVGYLFSSFLWTYVIFLVPFGILVDRYGGKAIATFGLSVWSIATLLTAATWNFLSILGTRLALGFGEATVLPAAGRIIREWMPANERAMGFAVFSSGTFAGPALGALLVGAVSSGYGWRTAFLVMGIISLVYVICFAIFYFRPEDAKWLSREERQDIISTRDPNPRQAEKSVGSGGLRELLRSRTIWGLCLTQASVVYANYLLLFWLPSYLQTSKGLTIMATGLFTALPYALAAPLSIGIGIISDRLLSREGIFSGRRRIAVVIMVALSSALLLVPFVSDFWLILVIFTVTLTAIASALALNTTLVSDLLHDPRHIGKATSLLTTAGNVFGLLAPIITGYVVAGLGSYDWAFGIAGILLLIGALASLLLTRRPIQVSDGHSASLATSGGVT
jgi:MFS family permease